MQNYKVHSCVISMEFLAVNRSLLRNATRAGSEEGRLFSQASYIHTYPRN